MGEHLRILQVAPMPPPVDGGISSYLEGLLRSPLRTQYELDTLDVRVSDFFRHWRPLRPLLTPTFVLRLAWRLHRRRPHVVHIHTSDYLGFWEKSLLTWTASLQRLPVVLHLHGGSFDRFLTGLSPWKQRWARRALARAGCVVVLAETWRPLLERFVVADRIAIVPNAVHCADFDLPRQAAEPGPLHILFVGMLSERKGLDELLQAIRILVEAGVREFRVDIVGGEEFPGEMQRYRGRYRAAGLDPWVRFHGLQDRAAKLESYRGADIFVLPSRNESFGIVNLEAMAAGLPVVSTRTGAIPEYLENEVHGLLVDPGDARGLAAALRRLLEDPALRGRLAAAARRRVVEYDWERVADKIGAIYRSLVPYPASLPPPLPRSVAPGRDA